MQNERITKLNDVQARLYKRLLQIDNEIDTIPQRNGEQRRKRLDLLQKIAATIARIDALSFADEDEESYDPLKGLFDRIEKDEGLSQETKKALMTYKEELGQRHKVS